MRNPIVFFLFSLTLLAVDLLSKSVAFARLTPGASIPLLPDVLHLTAAQNTGVAFSMLSGQTLVIVTLSFVAIAVLLWIYFSSRASGPALMLIAIGMILSGAMGNMFDRLMLGFVRDFIDFVPPLPLVGKWAIFNVADICITVGVILFLFSEFFLRRDEPRKAPEAGATHA